MTEARQLAAAGQLRQENPEIGEVSATVLTGGVEADPIRPITELDVLEVERDAVLSRARHPETLARIKAALKGGNWLNSSAA
jgi:3-hydroxyacyl-CoA dehydrogenase